MRDMAGARDKSMSLGEVRLDLERERLEGGVETTLIALVPEIDNSRLIKRARLSRLDEEVPLVEATIPPEKQSPTSIPIIPPLGDPFTPPDRFETSEESDIRFENINFAQCFCT